MSQFINVIPLKSGFVETGLCCNVSCHMFHLLTIENAKGFCLNLMEGGIFCNFLIRKEFQDLCRLLQIPVGFNAVFIYTFLGSRFCGIGKFPDIKNQGAP